ncbi:hypothetical protein SPRG_18878 [Saprolegnia parasitica CBS 223.65]|uniref:PH domain-containing protein n=1 Tax=Saprolegnia parasitica (strain CBS 223.65) TaxID=695850 RepID=A0A067D9S0_SAPPC|nr:hypothetical protein SPRG_18878 [Saprolegnia parasitica CBS 223.65]KDO35732.1 hypothetical protein SPRG_18878 [Saprolegnia parasitica CBS 223.65]|eukprot:XP_012194092.1 hypothetical protein SPRG_18878 [Saprolegnia parasitica CBS 223.65]
MYRDGFLILKDVSMRSSMGKPIIVFVVFQEGVLSFYSDKGGILLGSLALPGRITKVKAECDVPTQLPHRFTVASTEVTRIEGRRIKLGETRTLELSAPTHDLMKEWANSVHLWRRMNWKDDVTFFESYERMEHTDERSLLRMFLKMGPEPDATRPRSRSRIKMLSPIIKAFKRRTMTA